MAAVVLDMVCLFDLSQKLREVLRYASEAHKIPQGAELHAHPLMNARKEWKPLAGRHRAQEKIYTLALEAIVDSGAKVFIEGLDVKRQRERYSNPYPPHRVALGHVLERVNDYAVAKERDVLVMADEVPEQEEHAASMALYSLVGTPGYRSSTLPRIIQPVRFDDSRFHVGLQAADLVAYLYNRVKSTNERDARAQAAKDRMWKALQPAVHHHRMWVP